MSTSISFSKYVRITSGVGASSQVTEREFIGRLFTTNPLIPTGSILEFTTLEDVGLYFGTASEEYKRASFYFSWVSKNITQATKISYARWADVDTNALIFGVIQSQALSSYTSIANGAFILEIGGSSQVVSGLDFTAAVSLSQVASIIETAINALSGLQFTGATVIYNATRGSFDFVSGDVGAAIISVSPPLTGTNITPLIGWTSLAIYSNGADAQSITDVLTNTASLSNNFGSFLFLNSAGLDLSQVIEAATWNSAQNVMFQYMVRVSIANSSSYSAALFSFGGTAVTIAPLTEEYPEMEPMMILAATDYDAINSTQNYMFQQFNLTPSVTDTPTSNTLDELRVNYYGQTQTNGQQISFYQRGVLMGAITDPLDQNTYANEQWLKDAAGTSIINLLLALSKISANAQGLTQLQIILQNVIDRALRNGTISPGKPLTTQQKVYVTQRTGDPNAWYQVQGIGYWIGCSVNPTTNTATYTFIYSKDDIIRVVEGTHTLI
jgi:hypothetical protein